MNRIRVQFLAIFDIELSEKQQLVQSEQSHSAKIRCRVVALKADFSPLIGFAIDELLVRLQKPPQADEFRLVLLVVLIEQFGAAFFHFVYELFVAFDLTHTRSQLLARIHQLVHFDVAPNRFLQNRFRRFGLVAGVPLECTDPIVRIVT